MPIGARIRPHFSRPSADLVEAFKPMNSADVSDATERIYTADGAIRRVSPGPVPGPALVGPALTVSVRPEDHLMLHAAIDLAQPGDVIVVSTGGGSPSALMGELVCAWARHRGVAGIILDAPVRDVDLLSLPVFARGSHPRAPGRSAPGEVGYPISLGGVPVHPGDIVVADNDGIVFVPQSDAPLVLERTRGVVERDIKNRKLVTDGTWDRTWIPKALQAAGVTFEEE